MSFKHLAVVTAGVWVGSTFIAPLVLQTLPIAQDGGLVQTVVGAAAVALGVILVDKLL